MILYYVLKILVNCSPVNSRFSHPDEMPDCDPLSLHIRKHLQSFSLLVLQSRTLGTKPVTSDE